MVPDTDAGSTFKVLVIVLKELEQPVVGTSNFVIFIEVPLSV